MQALGFVSRALRLTALGLLLGAFGLAASAQGSMMNGHAYASGAVAQVSASSVTVNGVQAAVDGNTVFVGEDSSGNLVLLALSDVHTGDTASLFTETESGAIVAKSVFLGTLFMVQGQVTALQRDGQNVLQSVVIDGAYTIHTAQASFDYMGAGAMGSGMGGNMSGGMMSGGMMSSGDSSYVQLDSTLALGGLVRNGVFAAAFAHVMGTDMAGKGTLQSLSHDGSGNVTGFSMSSNGATTQCVLEASTQITKGGQMMGANSLKTGMHVKITGVTRQDGSVQVQTMKVSTMM